MTTDPAASNSTSAKGDAKPQIQYYEEPHCACGADDHDDAEHEYVDDEDLQAQDDYGEFVDA